MRWTRKSIVAEIKALHTKGVELNYATAEARNLNLVRAAAWHYGTWRRAVEAADIVYESICKYRRWDQERIVARIRELHAEGADLSWRSVSTEVDPPLAAAALRPKGFRTWREAIAAAGLNIDDVARYQCWSKERVLRDIKELKRAQAPLSSKAVQSSNQPLFCAARRRFGSWDEALAHAGLSADKIRLRRPTAQAGSKAATATSSPRSKGAGSSAAAGAAASGATKNKAGKRLKTAPLNSMPQANATVTSALPAPGPAKKATATSAAEPKAAFARSPLPPVEAVKNGAAKTVSPKTVSPKTVSPKMSSKPVAPAKPAVSKPPVSKTSATKTVASGKKSAAKPDGATAQVAQPAKKSSSASVSKAAGKAKTTDTVTGLVPLLNGVGKNGTAAGKALKNGAAKPATTSRRLPSKAVAANREVSAKRRVQPMNK